MGTLACFLLSCEFYCYVIHDSACMLSYLHMIPPKWLYIFMFDFVSLEGCFVREIISHRRHTFLPGVVFAGVSHILLLSDISVDTQDICV